MARDERNAQLMLLGHRAAVMLVAALPIRPTSVALRTAFDIVGRGIADPSMIVEPVKAAAQSAAVRQEE